jgi:hypothetical protein
MAATNGGYTTGAGKAEADLRRRNVSSYETVNGSTVNKVEAEDRKKLQKVSEANIPLAVLEVDCCSHHRSPASQPS